MAPHSISPQSGRNRRHPRPGTVSFDGDKLQRAMLRRGLTRSQLAIESNTSRSTIGRLFDGTGVFPGSAKLIAEALQTPLDQLLRDENKSDSGQASFGLPATAEWEVVGTPSASITASNGLQYRLARMRHRHEPGWKGRGKFYDLLGVPTDERDKLRNYLLRHTLVGNAISDSRYLARTLSCTPVDQGAAWWVIDSFVGETTLAKQFDSVTVLPPAELRRTMTEVALGLQTLHASHVILRELAPSRILLADDDGRAVLTDFELAKLLDGRPTVSTTWPDDPYRAPEVDSGQVTVRADFFSWGRIFVRALTGGLAVIPGQVEPRFLQRLPRPVSKLLLRCLAIDPSRRPTTAADLIEALSHWR